VRSEEYLAGLSDFADVGLDVRLATDNGTRGHHGFVTDLLRTELERVVPDTTVYCCGPEPMMHAVASLCAERQVTCYLSLETPMACGFGACFSCVTKVRQEDDSWDYRRVCVEGPIFKASELCLDDR
jgi:dihydroorotate dehydrogenase electron transfer subunit